VDPEKFMFTASVCAVAVMSRPDGRVEVGCPSHPPFDAPEQKPNGKVNRYEDDVLGLCTIDAIYKGSFTRAGAKQAILSFEQCYENPPYRDAWDAANPGSAVLVEETDGRWRARGYVPGVNAASCLKVPVAGGREILACRSGFGAPPSMSLHYFFQMDFAKPKDKRARSFALMYLDSLTCPFLIQGTDHGLVMQNVTEFRLSGSGEIVAEVARARAAPSPAFDAKVAASCKKNPELDPWTLLPRPTKTKLEFKTRGENIVPTEATKKVLAQWETQAGEDRVPVGVAPPAMGD
jgi:hypothetical protein